MEKVDKPKIFISYAWSRKEYEDKVLLLATKLRGDGIEAILDKWNLKEGHDTFSFMEKCVLDDSITNVLILLDPVYEQKADKREGGVGSETQIISPEIYNKVNQEKFIPIIMERKSDNSIPKPVFLKTLLHFDLSNVEKYDEEYIRLVKRLYGEEYYRTPELGEKPGWVEQDINQIDIQVQKYNILSQALTSKVLESKYSSFLTEIMKSLSELNFEKSDQITFDYILQCYDETRSIRSNFLELLEHSIYIDNAGNLLADFFESLFHNAMNQSDDMKTSIIKSFIHELLIYSTAILFIQKDFKSICSIITKTYYDIHRRENRTFVMFYYYNGLLDNAVNNSREKKFHSGTAEYWISNLDIKKCSKDQFVFADNLLYNASIYIEKFNNEYNWFPLTYIYGGRDNIFTTSYFKKMISRNSLAELLNMFGYNDPEKFKTCFKNIDSLIVKGNFERAGYSLTFEKAPLLNDIVNFEDLGSRI